MLDFNGQVVVVTGSGSPKGIGKTIAKTFARQGAQLIITDMNAQGVKDVVEEIQAEGGKAYGIVSNITAVSYTHLQDVEKRLLLKVF